MENAKALVAQAQVLEDHAHAAHEAGTAANLTSCARTGAVGAHRTGADPGAESAGEGPDPAEARDRRRSGQDIELTDQAPYSELAADRPGRGAGGSLQDRQDYQNLQNQAVAYKAAHAVYRSERLPTLSFYSYYGTSTVNGAGTHGNFIAAGQVNFPIFREAKLRGDQDVAKAKMESVNAQLADLRDHIDEQVRAALLDVNANEKLVDVGRSNVDLATRALSDETDRVNAGVDNNLPLVTAQATLATAESNLVESLYQYNVSKLALARAAGVLEQQYRTYLGQ